MAARVDVQVKDVESTINGGEQKQQMINIECCDDFAGAAANLHIQFL